MNKAPFKTFAIILLLFLSFQLTNGMSVRADDTSGEPSTKELIVQIMPEYITPDGWSEDGPAVLYGQHGLIVNESEEPYEGKFSVKLPLDDPTLTLALVGQVIEEGTLDVEYSINDKEQKVEWAPSEPLQPGEEYRYAVEYYYAPFTAGEDRAFTFEQVVDKDVDEMNVLFFEPFEAENVQLSKESENVMDMYGTPVHEYKMTDVKAGEKFELDIAYEKDSDMTTIEAMEQHAPDDEVHQGMAQGDQDNSNGSGTLISNESAVMISISIIIAGLFVYLGLKNKQKTASVSVANPSHAKAGKLDDKEKSNLRKQLINGQIDEKTYKDELSKFS